MNGNPANYRITIQGELDSKWSDWFSGMRVDTSVSENGRVCTTLYGVVADQAQLRSLLTRIWDLNLILIQLIRMEEE